MFIFGFIVGISVVCVVKIYLEIKKFINSHKSNIFTINNIDL